MSNVRSFHTWGFNVKSGDSCQNCNVERNRTKPKNVYFILDFPGVNLPSDLKGCYCCHNQCTNKPINQLINQSISVIFLKNVIYMFKKRTKMPHWDSSTKMGNHNIRRETRHTMCSSRYRLSTEWFFTLTSHYCSGERLISKLLNFGGRWQNCQFPHGAKSQLASPHLLSAGRKSYYFVYIKIWNMLKLAHCLLRCCIVHIQAQSEPLWKMSLHVSWLHSCVTKTVFSD